MPEGHTIHRELRRQAPALVGRPIDASSPNRRFGSGAAAGLGPDPIRTDDDGGAVLPRLAAYDGPIGAALLDQSVVAGIGNIYRAEVLFAAGIHPERPACSIDSAEWERIWAAAVRMLRAGVSHEPKAAVYQRRMCPRCGFPVRHWHLQGREAWACERCQPLRR